MSKQVVHCGDEQKAFRFDRRPWAEQIQAICQKFGKPYDEDDNYYLLTQGVSSDTSRVLRSRAKLAEDSDEAPPVRLQLASVLVQEKLDRLSSASPGQVPERLQSLLELMLGDAVLASHVIEKNGIQLVLAASSVAAAAGPHHMELAMACLCELFQQEAACGWLEEHQEEELHPALFRRLLSAIFPTDVKESVEDVLPPLASLSVCLFLMQELKGCVAATHAAAKGGSIDDKSDASPKFFEPFYRQIVTAADDGDDADSFQSVSASLVLSAMALATRDDQPLQAEILREVRQHAGSEGDSEALKAFRKTEAAKVQADNLLTGFMCSCTELAMSRSSMRKQAELLQQLSQLDKKTHQLQEHNSKLTKEIRKMHHIMCKMVNFVRVENDKVIESQLESIVRYGWDSLHWKRGYNMLHYASECVDDPKVVELVGLFATNVDAADDNNMRPIDYARHRKADGVVKAIQKLRKQARKFEQGEDHKDEGGDHLAPRKEASAAAKERLHKMEGLSSELRKAIGNVMEVGWHGTPFPSNFTPVHSAAKSGHVEVISLLVELGADLARADDYGLTPMDYAAQGGHDNVVIAIREHIASQKGARRQVAVGDSPASGSAARAAAGGATSEPEPGPTPAPSPRRKPLPKAEPTAEERALIPVPAVARPELQRAIEVVRRKPWSRIKWPHNFTALHLAAELGSAEVVQFLLDATAAPSLETQDAKGRTPLAIAKSHGFSALEDLLSPPPADLLKPPAPRSSKHTSESAYSRMTGSSTASSPSRSPARRPPGARPVDSVECVLSTGGSPKPSSRWDPFKKSWAQHKAMCSMNGHAHLDLLKERLRIREQAPDDLGLLELRAEVARLRQENEAWHEERRACRGGDGRADATGGGKRGGRAGGPLDEKLLVKYMKQVDMFGRDKVMGKLMDSPLVGGMAFDSATALKAMEQIELMLRLADFRTKEPDEEPDAPVEQPASVEGAPAAGKAKAPPPSKGKGKAGAAGAPVAEEEPSEESGAQPASAKGPAKGPGKGKKGPPAKAGDAAPAAGAAGKGPGKGPAGAGKGPPGKGGPPRAKAKAGAAKANGGAAVEFAKPKVTPAKPMKPLWWNKMNFGLQLIKGETVWDDVMDDLGKLPIGDLVDRFAKTGPAARPKKDGVDGQEKKKDVVQLIQVVKDPKARQGKELSLKHCPPAPALAKSIQELDDTVLSVDLLKIAIENACPTPDELKQLQEERQKQPDVPFAVIEQYFWVIGQLPAVKQRMELWMFVRTYREQFDSYISNLNDFMSVITCFRESETLPSLLGLILAVGNYLNGGTNRGQADGFDLETLGKLESIKDPQGKDIRSFIFEVFFSTMAEIAAEFIEEMNPLFLNVSRRINRDSDGTEKLSKSARVSFEDFDMCVKSLDQEFTRHNETMKMVLQYFEDPADPFRLRMPKAFADAKIDIESLVKLKDDVKQGYGELLSFFKINGMKSSEFCLLWDNLVVPPDLIVNADADTKKKIMIPAFCQGKPLTLGYLEVLWQFKEPAEGMKSTRVATKKRPGKKRRRFGRRSTANSQSIAAALPKGAASPAGAAALPKAGAKGKGKGGKAAPAAPVGEEPSTLVEAKAAPAAKGKGKLPPAGPPAGAEASDGATAAPEASAPAAAEAVGADTTAAPAEGAAPLPQQQAMCTGKGKGKGKGKAKGPAPPADDAASPEVVAKPPQEEWIAAERMAANFRGPSAAVEETPMAADFRGPSPDAKGKAKGKGKPPPSQAS